jgi:hypothetical protein
MTSSAASTAPAMAMACQVRPSSPSFATALPPSSRMRLERTAGAHAWVLNVTGALRGKRSAPRLPATPAALGWSQRARGGGSGGLGQPSVGRDCGPACRADKS